jgi:hypothetical protein
MTRSGRVTGAVGDVSVNVESIPPPTLTPKPITMATAMSR